MRIGIDLFGTQTSSRHRGIGRYCRNLAAALLAEGGGHEFILLADSEAPLDLIPSAPNARSRLIDPEPTLGDALARFTRDNPDGLDLLILTNPLELTPGFNIPTKPDGLRIAAVVYDLIPLIFQADYLLKLPREAYVTRYLRALRRLCSYDLLFVISEATRADFARLLKFPEDRLVSIGTGADDPALDRVETVNESASLDRFGLAGTRFVYTVGASDPRKNLGGLIEAFGRLPNDLAARRKLVITAPLSDGERRPLEARAARFGVADRLVFTGPVDDPTLRSLYRACEVFAFPSLYEGFGLPIVEALRHGAAVIAGRNSSQTEAAGDAALLVNNADPLSIADGIATLLNDPALAQSFKSRAPAQSRKFQWSRCAQTLLRAVEQPLPKPAAALVSQPLSKPVKTTKLAWLSPLPPNPSGIADYSRALLPAIESEHAIDLYHDGPGVPFARFEAREASCLDARVFLRMSKARSHDAIIYQMGNSPHHFQAYQAALTLPGIVVLHDLALISFHFERTRQNGSGPQGFLEELLYSHPDRFESYRPRFQSWSERPEVMMADLVGDGLTMCRRLAEHAGALIVHSAWAASRLRAMSPAIARKTFVIRHGAEPRPCSPSDRTEARSRLGLPLDALLVGSFGSVHRSKLNVETVEAFAELLKHHPKAILLIVGQENDEGLARDKVQSLGLESKVRFRGRPDDHEFLELIAATDLGVNLRCPPTNGETSGALLHLLSAGLPAIVTDTGSFGEYDDRVVRKIPWKNHRDGTESLKAALIELAASPEARQALGAAALESIRDWHHWPIIASEYAKVIRFVKQENNSLYKPLLKTTKRRIVS